MKTSLYVLLFVLLISALSAVCQTNTRVLTSSPLGNTYTAAPEVPVKLFFSHRIDPSSVNGSTLVVSGSTSGRRQGTIEFENSDSVVVFRPVLPFVPGEKVIVSATRGLKNLSGTAIQNSYVFEFAVKTKPSEGVFAAPIRYSTGTNIEHMGVADFDRDGFNDIVCAKTQQGELMHFRNNPAEPGTFLPGTSYPAFLVSDLRVADVNNDGYPDVLTVHSNNALLSVYINSGTGQFLPAANYTLSRLP